MSEFVIVAIFTFAIIVLGLKLGLLDGVLRRIGQDRSSGQNKVIAFGITALFVSIIMGVGMIAVMI